MSVTALRDALVRNLDLIHDHLSRVSGERGDALYVDNYDGTYTYDTAPVVTELGLCDSAADFTHSESEVEQSSEPAILYDLTNDTRHDYDGSAWTSTAVPRDDIMTMRRLYYSPYTNKVFLYDTSGRVEQLRGTSV